MDIDYDDDEVRSDVEVDPGSSNELVDNNPNYVELGSAIHSQEVEDVEEVMEFGDLHQDLGDLDERHNRQNENQREGSHRGASESDAEVESESRPAADVSEQSVSSSVAASPRLSAAELRAARLKRLGAS